MKYDKTEIGWLLTGIFLAVFILLTTLYLCQIGERPIPWILFLCMGGFFIFITLLFYKLRIKVDDAGIHLIYGIGLIRINIKPEKITEITVIRTPIHYGLGIKITPMGMLYNIQSRNALVVKYSEGKDRTVLIGCNDCSNLKHFLEMKYK